MSSDNEKLAACLNEVVVVATRDLERSRKVRSRDFDRGRRLCDQIVQGITGREHNWCVVFRASAARLVTGGLAHADWFTEWPRCREVVFGGRTIELFRQGGGEVYELTICYKASDCADHDNAFIRNVPAAVRGDSARVAAPPAAPGKTYRLDFDRCGRPLLKSTRRGSGKAARSRLQREVDALYSDKSADA